MAHLHAARPRGAWSGRPGCLTCQESAAAAIGRPNELAHESLVGGQVAAAGQRPIEERIGEDRALDQGPSVTERIDRRLDDSSNHRQHGRRSGSHGALVGDRDDLGKHGYPPIKPFWPPGPQTCSSLEPKSYGPHKGAGWFRDKFAQPRLRGPRSTGRRWRRHRPASAATGGPAPIRASHCPDASFAAARPWSDTP